MPGGPRLGDQPRAGGRPDGFGPLGKLPVIVGGEQALLERQLANSDFQYLEVGNFIDHRRRWMVVIAVRIVVVVRLWHALCSHLASVNR